MPPSRDAAPQGTSALSVRDLRHSYAGREALQGISLEIAPGELFALLGPNGGGKTTLFRILATLMIPTGGEALVFGIPVATGSVEIRRRLGVVFQNPSLDTRLTCMENMIHHGHLHGLSGAALKRRAAELLGWFGVADRAGDRVESLSGGLARRVELAKSLLHSPDLLILDEPSTGLDPSARLEFMRILRSMREEHGVTIVLTTHFLEEAERSDRVAILDAGKIVATGSPEELRSRIGGDVVTLRSSTPAELGERVTERFGLAAHVLNGSVRIEAPRGHEILREVVEAFPEAILSASFGHPTLEDVFVRLTGRKLGEAGGGAA
jgi:ABC-2 type transport system ATP-binding protein